MENKYAPIMIPTLCRYEHFKRCIESLKKNSWARYTDLYIGLDYPAQESHFAGYDKIKEYLEAGIDGFSHVTIIRHNSNVGSSGNGNALRDILFEKYDRYIFSEDDNEFSPNYLEYMNKCLNKYEEDENILAVTGYRYPFDSSAIKGTVFTSNVYFAAFGYGTWKKKYIVALNEINMKLFCDKYYDSKFMKYFRSQGPNQYCNFVKGMLGYTSGLISNGQVLLYDLAFGIYMISKEKRMIFPTVSKVRNWGYDGSGVHCNALMYEEEKPITHRNFGFECQELDNDSGFEIAEEKELSQQEINGIVSKFFEISQKELVRTNVSYHISRVIGLANMRKIISKLTKYC